MRHEAHLDGARALVRDRGREFVWTARAHATASVVKACLPGEPAAELQLVVRGISRASSPAATRVSRRGPSTWPTHTPTRLTLSVASTSVALTRNRRAGPSFEQRTSASMTVAAFCERLGVPRATSYRWRRQQRAVAHTRSRRCRGRRRDPGRLVRDVRRVARLGIEPDASEISHVQPGDGLQPGSTSYRHLNYAPAYDWWTTPRCGAR